MADDPCRHWTARCPVRPGGCLAWTLRRTTKEVREPICTTVPVLTEAFHLLEPNSPGARRLMDFVADTGLAVWFLDGQSLSRAFELMQRYADVPMDFADASLVAAAETLNARKIFTIDRKDFAVYRVRRGHRQLALQVLN